MLRHRQILYVFHIVPRLHDDGHGGDGTGRYAAVAHWATIEAMMAGRHIAEVEVGDELVVLAVGSQLAADGAGVLIVAVNPILKLGSLAARELQEQRTGDGGVFPVRLSGTEAELVDAVLQLVSADAETHRVAGAAQIARNPTGEIIVEPVFISCQRLRKGQGG